MTDDDTAVALGSGEVPALGDTPAAGLVRGRDLCRAGARACPSGTTSVGTRASLEHLHPTPVGAAVDVTAVLAYTDGRLLRFEVVAHDAGGKVVAHGEITRVAVQRDRFLARLAR